MSLFDHTTFDTNLLFTGHIKTYGMASQEQKHGWSCSTWGGL
jgi:hypothetical protein